MISHTLARDVPIEAFVDWKTVFNLVAKSGNTTERRLQINVPCMCEFYENRELAHI